MRQPRAERAAELRKFLVCGQAGQRGQQIGGERDPEQPLRKFHQTHRVVESGDDGGFKPEREGLSEEHVDLKSRDTDRPGNHFANDFSNGRVLPGRLPF
ncbi:hypothetical protein SDC9_168225 [bioreactor metagenome]|uniref:Uncharacterized protein n=1 Tax=bioreactor metagenome TaxID=1076179 RepID=A0A645G3Y2_9ZZZZ